MGLDLRYRDIYLLRLPYQPGCRCAQGTARHHLQRRHPLRPRAYVLVLRTAAMVLGTLETRLPGVDRRPLCNQKTPWARPDETNQGIICPVEKSSRRHDLAAHVSPKDATNPPARGRPLAARLLQRAHAQLLQGVGGAWRTPMDVHRR